jgi:hypothetical protein
MKLEGHVYCEGPDCEHHWRAGLSRFKGRTLMSLPPGWVIVRIFEGEAESTEHGFCEPNCALKWLAANSEPSEVLE